LDVFKAFHGLVPEYISELLCPYSSFGPLRSSEKLLLAVLRWRLVNKGGNAFVVAAEQLNVPSLLTAEDSIVLLGL